MKSRAIFGNQLLVKMEKVHSVVCKSIVCIPLSVKIIHYRASKIAGEWRTMSLGWSRATRKDVVHGANVHFDLAYMRTIVLAPR